ncbi:dirigent protein 22-like [Henckelia pumila]|uniref:dirigent protein 22-like n=1 Tax=Henckelia pumila TaxID=405737 RepID=UPI003C6E617F
MIIEHPCVFNFLPPKSPHTLFTHAQKMAKPLAASILLFSAVICLLMCVSSAQKGHRSVQKWFKNLPHAKLKVTELHFYFHDVVGGKNPTVVSVARANSTSDSPTMFGLVMIVDDPLTAGPDPKSKIVGRAKGVMNYASMEEMGMLMTINFVFTGGKYNGSSLSVVGYNPIQRRYREMSVVGGSGVFRLARGVATAETAAFDAESGNAVVEYNVLVLHY